MNLTETHENKHLPAFKKRAEANTVPCIMESDSSLGAYRKSWVRLIRKIYEIDPLICPKCRGTMRIISSIEDQDVIKTILEHLGLWLGRPDQYFLQKPMLHRHMNTIWAALRGSSMRLSG